MHLDLEIFESLSPLFTTLEETLSGRQGALPQGPEALPLPAFGNLPSLVRNVTSGSNRSGNEGGWTDLLRTSSDSVGSSEPSINQPAGPEPVAPEVAQPDGGGPSIPEDPNVQNLIPAEVRMEELRNRLAPNAIGKHLSESEIRGIVAAQIVIEETVETALVEDGFRPGSIIEKRHQIRGFMFYPSGTAFHENTYYSYVKAGDDLGTRATIPYKRIMKALEKYDLFLDRAPPR